MEDICSQRHRDSSQLIDKQTCQQTKQVSWIPQDNPETQAGSLAPCVKSKQWCFIPELDATLFPDTCFQRWSKGKGCLFGMQPESRRLQVPVAINPPKKKSPLTEARLKSQDAGLQLSCLRSFDAILGNFKASHLPGRKVAFVSKWHLGDGPRLKRTLAPRRSE